MQSVKRTGQKFQVIYKSKCVNVEITYTSYPWTKVYKVNLEFDIFYLQKLATEDKISHWISSSHLSADEVTKLGTLIDQYEVPYDKSISNDSEFFDEFKYWYLQITKSLTPHKKPARKELFELRPHQIWHLKFDLTGNFLVEEIKREIEGEKQNEIEKKYRQHNKFGKTKTAYQTRKFFTFEFSILYLAGIAITCKRNRLEDAQIVRAHLQGVIRWIKKGTQTNTKIVSHFSLIQFEI